MTELAPFNTLLDQPFQPLLALPAALANLYGPLRLDRSQPGLHVAANFVSTLDGVASLAVPGQAGGGPISGFNRHDLFCMALLRAVADAVVLGAGSLRESPQRLLTAQDKFPELAP